jgi:hypothetical protein
MRLLGLRLVIVGCLTLALSAASAEAVPVPTVSLPNGEFLAVSCSSPSACTAVGLYSAGNNDTRTFVERWNGFDWAVQPSPNPAGATYSYLAGVSCASSSSCTAVGSSSTLSTARTITLTEQWDGNSWAIKPSPSPTPTGTDVLEGVSCAARDACTAVGLSQTGGNTANVLVEAWNGTTWTTQSAPNFSGGPWSELHSVSCPSKTECVAVGNGGAEVSNGGTWTIQTMPTADLASVSCASVTACLAVGGFVAEEWNGVSWSQQAGAQPAAAGGRGLSSVSCSSDTACTAAGSQLDSAGTYVPLAERWNGSGWQIQPTPVPLDNIYSVLNGVSCPSRNACTAVGLYERNGYPTGDDPGGPLIEHWDGSNWRIQTAPPALPSLLDTVLNNLSGLGVPLPSLLDAVFSALSGLGL